MDTVFDTLAFSRKLQKGSFSAEQSDALADAVHEAVRGSVATKNDLDLAVARIDGQMQLLKWMTGATFGGVVALVMKAFL